MCSTIPFPCKQPATTGCCCHKCKNSQMIRGKFGLAWVVETPDCKLDPAGWQVEFFDTPSRVFQRCQNMIDWVSTPPVSCSCSLPIEDCPNEQDFPPCYCERCCPKQSCNMCSVCGRFCNCQTYQPIGYSNCCGNCQKQSEEQPVKDQTKVDKASSAASMKSKDMSMASSVTSTKTSRKKMGAKTKAKPGEKPEKPARGKNKMRSLE